MFPTEIWQIILKYLYKSPNQFRLVCRTFNTLMSDFDYSWPENIKSNECSLRFLCDRGYTIIDISYIIIKGYNDLLHFNYPITKEHLNLAIVSGNVIGFNKLLGHCEKNITEEHTKLAAKSNSAEMFKTIISISICDVTNQLLGEIRVERFNVVKFLLVNVKYSNTFDKETILVELIFYDLAFVKSMLVFEEDNYLLDCILKKLSKGNNLSFMYALNNKIIHKEEFKYLPDISPKTLDWLIEQDFVIADGHLYDYVVKRSDRLFKKIKINVYHMEFVSLSTLLSNEYKLKYFLSYAPYDQKKYLERFCKEHKFYTIYLFNNSEDSNNHTHHNIHDF